MRMTAMGGMLAVLASSPVLAATQTWDFVNGSGSAIENDNAHGIGTGSYIDMTVGGIEVVVSAWSSTGGDFTGGGCGAAPECQVGENTQDLDPFIERADIKKYGGGLGVLNNDETDNVPDHSTDSYNANDIDLDYDMILLQFSDAVALDEVDIDWPGDSSGYDRDISIAAYTGGSAISGVPFGSNTMWSDLLASGWGFSENYSNLSAGFNQVISSPVESRYWLIGAYNPVFGDTWTYGNDAVKIAGVITSTTPSTQVSEPVSLLLLLSGLLGIRRRTDT